MSATEFKNYRDESRVNWGRNVEAGQTLNRDDLKFGALLRIADATEKMAQRHTDLMNSAKLYQESADYWRRQYESMERRCRALKGQITKLKKKERADV